MKFIVINIGRMFIEHFYSDIFLNPIIEYWTMDYMIFDWVQMFVTLIVRVFGLKTKQFITSLKYIQI